MHLYFENRFMAPEQAGLSLQDLSIQRGYGIFEFFRTRGNTPLFLEDHLERFFRSAELMHLHVPHSWEKIMAIIYELIHRNNLNESGIRIGLSGGILEEDTLIRDPVFFIMQSKLSMPSWESYSKGVKVITHPFTRELPLAKTINYATAVWMLPAMKKAGAADILYHQGENVSEFSRRNIFIVNDENEILTPTENILLGITRKKVLELAKEKKYTVIEKNITLYEVYRAKEVFMTSTIKRVMPVVAIDDKQIGDGRPQKITIDLLTAFMAMEQQLTGEPANL
ncbi:MAG: amino acid aminotransferase [Terrimonas sp.]|nr:amino acid aminotransferase [Terrimonas sp.]